MAVATADSATFSYGLRGKFWAAWGCILYFCNIPAWNFDKTSNSSSMSIKSLLFSIKFAITGIYWQPNFRIFDLLSNVASKRSVSFTSYRTISSTSYRFSNQKCFICNSEFQKFSDTPLPVYRTYRVGGGCSPFFWVSGITILKRKHVNKDNECYKNWQSNIKNKPVNYIIIRLRIFLTIGHCITSAQL